jgi:hypothetical protein
MKAKPLKLMYAELIIRYPLRAKQFGLAGVEDCFVSYLTQGFISEKSFNLWLLDVK